MGCCLAKNQRTNSSGGGVHKHGRKLDNDRVARNRTDYKKSRIPATATKNTISGLGVARRVTKNSKGGGYHHSGGDGYNFATGGYNNSGDDYVGGSGLGGGCDSGVGISGGCDSGGVYSGGCDSGGAYSGGAYSGGCDSGGAYSGGCDSGGGYSGGCDSGGGGSYD